MSSSSPRHAALRAAAERRPTTFPRPKDAQGNLQPVERWFGRNTFGIAEMRQHLPTDAFRRFELVIARGEPLDKPLADQVARAVLQWAGERGATHFCHWFQPMTGSTAEKHDGFIDFDGSRPIARFSGSQLIQSEPDASSFPSGGMRSTFEARGYTAWDPTSPIFLMEQETGATLCIPSVFVSYHGDALDKKTPLLRSMRALSVQATALMQALGHTEVQRVTATAGPEQEYFLIDRAYAALRPDLLIGGRTVLGAPAPKGQTLEDHYFGAIPARVQAFMHEIEVELYKLGVPAKTRHNEVAPAQFELAVLYAEANVAADHNQLVMEIMRRVSARHGFAVLLHEKPFAGMNGSGKHLNWSMADDQGRNLLDPGAHPEANPTFLAFLAATLLGVHRNAALLRASIASHGNDFRLGANEAPPAIISAFLGNKLSAVADAITGGSAGGGRADQARIELGVHALPDVQRDNTDRNRTSPFAFTGNKFEFRAVGSNMSVSWPLACLNTAVADGIATFRAMLEARGGDVMRTVADALRSSEDIRFEGNNYASSWVEEAERRGLPHARHTAAALEGLRLESTRAVFQAHGVLTEAELSSRYHVQVERYLTIAEIEVDLLGQLIDQHVLPSALAERTALAQDLAALQQAGAAAGPEDRSALDQLTLQITELRAARAALSARAAELGALPLQARAEGYATELSALAARARAAADAIEARVADSRWTLPRYREMVFQSW